MSAVIESAKGAIVRDAHTIIRDFTDASGRLFNIAKDWREGQFRRGDLTDAANTIEGLRALLVELRQGESQSCAA